MHGAMKGVNNVVTGLAGDHLRRSMLEVGSAREPLAYVEGLLGPGHLQHVAGGYKPRIDSLLQDLGIQ